MTALNQVHAFDKNSELADHVVELAESLGFNVKRNISSSSRNKRHRYAVFPKTARNVSMGSKEFVLCADAWFPNYSKPSPVRERKALSKLSNELFWMNISRQDK